MRIRALREQQSLTLRAFGERAGVHPSHVMAIELGQLAANSETLRAIAVGLGVTSADLLNHGAEPDDLGGIVELLRQQPALVPIALARVKVMSTRKLGAFTRARARRDQTFKAMASQGANA
jgi:transcriptional regulator with XRE-family HTH domain